MKTRRLKKILASVLIVSSLASVAPVLADNYEDQVEEAEQQAEDHEQAAKSLDDLMAQLTDEVTDTQSALDNLTNNIQRNEQFLEDAVAELGKAHSEMKALQEEIAVLEQNIENRWGQLEAQARKIQVNGNSTTNIDFILNAESLTDILARVDIVSKVVGSSSQMLEDQIEDQQAVVEKTEETERKILQQNALAAELEKTAANLESQKVSQEALVAQLQIEQSSIGSERAELIAQRNEALQRVEQIENEREQVRLAIENAETSRQQVVNNTGALNEGQADSTRPATSNSASASAGNHSSQSNAQSGNRPAAPVEKTESAPGPAPKPEEKPAPAPKPKPEEKPKPIPKPVGAAPGHVLPYARKYMGTPYLFGGTTPDAFDCSGFTQYVFAEAGISIPRNSTSQFASTAAEEVINPQPGDLVFFGIKKSDNKEYLVEHVGICVGGGRFIGSQYNGVREESLTSGHWLPRIIGYRRY